MRVMQAAHLIALDGPHPGTAVPLSPKSLLGTEDGVLVQLDGEAAAQEALIQYDDLGWRAFDLGGRGAVSINGIRADAADLAPGDSIQVAGRTFEFAHGQPDPSLLPPDDEPAPPPPPEPARREPAVAAPPPRPCMGSPTPWPPSAGSSRSPSSASGR